MFAQLAARFKNNFSKSINLRPALRKKRSSQNSSRSAYEALEPRQLLAIAIGGEITSDTTLSDTTQAYCLDDDLTIGSDATLTISPGVTIEMRGNRIVVNGNVDANNANITDLPFDGLDLIVNDGGFFEATDTDIVAEVRVEAGGVYSQTGGRLSSDSNPLFFASAGVMRIDGEVYFRDVTIGGGVSPLVREGGRLNIVSSELVNANPVVYEVGSFGNIIDTRIDIERVETEFMQLSYLEITSTEVFVSNSFIDGDTIVRVSPQVAFSIVTHGTTFNDSDAPVYLKGTVNAGEFATLQPFGDHVYVVGDAPNITADLRVEGTLYVKNGAILRSNISFINGNTFRRSQLDVADGGRIIAFDSTVRARVNAFDGSLVQVSNSEVRISGGFREGSTFISFRSHLDTIELIDDANIWVRQSTLENVTVQMDYLPNVFRDFYGNTYQESVLVAGDTFTSSMVIKEIPGSPFLEFVEDEVNIPENISIVVRDIEIKGRVAFNVNGNLYLQRVNGSGGLSLTANDNSRVNIRDSRINAGQIVYHTLAQGNLFGSEFGSSDSSTFIELRNEGMFIGNNFFRAGDISVLGDSSTVIDMRFNDWGTNDVDEIEDRIFHRNDAGLRPLVIFQPTSIT